MNKWLNFGDDPDHRLDTGIVFRIHHYWEIRKVLSTDCTVRPCSAGRHNHSNYDVITSPALRPMTDNGTDIARLVRRALAEVCTVPVLPVSSLLMIVFTVRCYASTVYAVAVYPSVTSRLSIKTTQTTPWFEISEAKDLVEIRMGSLPTVHQIQVV